MKKRALSMLLAVLLLLSCLPVTAAAQEVANAASGKYGGGTGVEGDPYLIETAAHLKELADTVNSGNACTNTYFLLTQDIDLSSVCGENLNGGTSWSSIGARTTRFAGVFDGGNHKLTGLYVHGTNSSEPYGLFSWTGTGSVIQNLNVKGSVTGGFSTGGIVGLGKGLVDHSGKGNGNYDPTGKSTRAEAASMLMRYLEKE